MTTPIPPQLVQDGERGQHRQLPPTEFYWHVLELDGIPIRSGRLARNAQLEFLFESALPIPIEEIHAVYAKVPLGPGDKPRYVACGMRRSDLESRIAAWNRTAPLSLTPFELPNFIREKLGDAADRMSTQSLNLLEREYEPKIVRRARRRIVLQLAAALICLSVLLLVGLERRTAHALAQVISAEQARGGILQQVLGRAAIVSGGLPPELELLAELRTLRSTRHQPSVNLTPDDCTKFLADLLAHWPSDLHVQTESVVLTPNQLTIRAAVPASNDVQRLVNSLQHVFKPPLWGWQQPQINASRDAVQTTLQARHIKEKNQ